MDDAIDSFPTTDTYVSNAVADRLYQLSGTEQIDLTNVFDSQSASTPITKTIESISDPSVASVSIVGETLTINASAFNPGTTTVTIRGTATNDSIAFDEFNIIVTNQVDGVIEDFEDGNFTGSFTWTLANSGSPNRDFSVSTNTPYEGTYGAVTADNRDLSSCSMTTTVNYTAPGIVSFWKKVSSEANFDYLTLYIDDIAVGQWSGEVAWSQSNFAVDTAGDHTFKFEYTKDEAVTSGSDLAWVDYIEFYTDVTYVTPPATTLVSPTDASSVSTSTPTFEWDDVSGATSYDILVDNNSDFTSPEIDLTVDQSTYTVATKSLTDGTYYWKTKVTSGSSPYSDTWSVTVSTGGGTTPAVPANVVTIISGSDLVIDWDVSADATGYDVYSSDDPYGAFTLATSVGTNQYTVAADQAKLFYYIIATNGTKEAEQTITVSSDIE